MSLLLKSTVATEPSEESIAKDFQSSMAELEAFVKSRGTDASKPLEGKDGTKTDTGKTEDKTNETTETITKSATDTGGAETGNVVDGEQVISDFKATLTKSIASVQANVQTAQKSTDDAVLILAKSVHALQTVVATLHDQMSAFGNAGRPRKSLLTVVTKSVGGQEDTPKLSANEMLTKAVASTLTAAQVGEVRQYLQANQPVPDYLMREIDKVK